MMKITGLSHLFKWENLHNLWLTNTFLPHCIIIECEQSIAGNRPVKEILQLYHSMSQHSSDTANSNKYTNGT